MRGDLADVKALLQTRVVELARELAPEGYRAGAYWIAKNPARNDNRPGSFWIALAGTPGAWRDEATGQKGDALAFVQHCLNLPDVKSALAWSRGWLGIAQMPPELRQRRIAAQRQANAHDAQQAAAQAEQNRKRAFGLYVAAKKAPILGSPIDRYLQTRGIHLSALGRLPGALGWLPDGYHAETKTRWPMMVAGISGPNGRLIACHRTFIALDGSGKAPVEPARKVWPSFAGGAIRLWRGDSKLSVEDAAKQGLRETLGIVEGVEDGLSLALACPELRIWCAVSLGNLAQIVLPECVDDALVCADNDWGKPQAQRQFEKGLQALARQDVSVRVARSHIGKDVNNALMGARG